MKKKYIVLQEDKSDCAAACIQSIIKYYKGYLPLENIRNIINTTSKGTNAYDLIKGCNEIGFFAKAERIKINDLMKTNIKPPFIAHVKKNDMYHFIVIYGINNKHSNLTIMDPACGYKRISYEDFEQIFLNVIIGFQKIKELPMMREENKLLKKIIKYIIKDKISIFLLFILSFIVLIFSSVSALYYKIIIDNKISSIKELKTYFIIFLIFIIIKNIFSYIRTKLSININNKLETFIKQYSLKNIFNLPYTYYKNKTAGDIVSRVNDLDTIMDVLSKLILNVFIDLFLVLISFIVIFIYNKKLCFLLLVILLLYLMVVKLFKNILYNNIRSIQEEKSIYNSNLVESLESLESINNLNIKDKRVDILIDSSNKVAISNKKLNLVLNVQHFFKDLIYEVGLLCIVSVGYVLVIKSVIKVGDLIAIYMLITFFLDIVKSFMDNDLSIRYALKSISRVNSLLIESNSNNTNLTIHKDIIITNLSYSYGSQKVLNNFNLIINKKEQVLLKGVSGSGKSTLLKILLKYLCEYDGIIEFENNNLKNIDKQILNNSILYVGQNESILNLTIKENILMDRNINSELYNKVIKICKVDEIINTKIQKDNTLIEENGFNLSGGEKQRIILARGLLKKCNYIFLDEALSEVSIDMEKEIIKNIIKEYGEKTLIYTSHKVGLETMFKKIVTLQRRN